MWCRVLLVDDDEGALNALRRELVRPPNIGPEGLEIEGFSRPEEALARLREVETDFDLVIADYRMPGLDGIAFLRELHAIHPDTVRILLTGYVDAEDVIKAINDAQVDLLLTKPWHEFDLKGRIALSLHYRQIRKRQRGADRVLIEGVRMHREPYDVMLIDDDPAVLAALEREICHGGLMTSSQSRPLFRVRRYTSPLEALKAAVEHVPDLAICDFAMPELDGVTFFHRLREHCPDTVRILISGRSDIQMLIDAVNVAGVYHFLAKPWRTAELKATLVQALVYRELVVDTGFQ